jgi:glutathione S-transferase
VSGLRLFGSGRSRWVRPLWMLRELSVPFEAVVVDRTGGDLDSDWFRALNPSGKIPVLVDASGPVCESGAILLYLGDKFPDAGLVPRAGTYARGRHDQWMFTIATEFEQPLWQLHKQVNKGVGDAAVGQRARDDFAVAAAVFEAVLTDRRHLLGAGFTAADIMLSHLLTWEVCQELLSDLPALCAYRDRTTSRPGFPRHLYDGVAWVGLAP